ncbi:hypothetical protein SGPA1_21999 [Streptomyces misionensis JCM 4497]
MPDGRGVGCTRRTKHDGGSEHARLSDGDDGHPRGRRPSDGCHDHGLGESADRGRPDRRPAPRPGRLHLAHERAAHRLHPGLRRRQQPAHGAPLEAMEPGRGDGHRREHGQRLHAVLRGRPLPRLSGDRAAAGPQALEEAAGRAALHADDPDLRTGPARRLPAGHDLPALGLSAAERAGTEAFVRRVRPVVRPCTPSAVPIGDMLARRDSGSVESPGRSARRGAPDYQFNSLRQLTGSTWASSHRRPGRGPRPRSARRPRPRNHGLTPPAGELNTTVRQGGWCEQADGRANWRGAMLKICGSALGRDAEGVPPIDPVMVTE